MDEVRHIETSFNSLHNGRTITADAHFIENGIPKTTILFNHGFKGFKDWGPFNLLAKEFARAGYFFIKMNFSHNGVSGEVMDEITDTEAFANNNFSIELDDTGVVIDALFSPASPWPTSEYDAKKLILLGHSRGGTSALLKSAEDSRIKGTITWSAPSRLDSWFSEEQLNYWKQAGRIYVKNARTGQELPLDYQLAKNYMDNRSRLTVPHAIAKLTNPLLVIHAKDDETVAVQSAQQIKDWCLHAEVELLEEVGHTLGGKHPWEKKTLPGPMLEAIARTIQFIDKIK